jgi:3-oxoacyl-[acyl-carrier protein] reductase
MEQMWPYSSSVESALALENELNALGIKAKGYQSNAADFDEAQTMVDAVLWTLELIFD